MNRRSFLETSLASAVIASVPHSAFADTHQIDKIGMQLYTVRKSFKKEFAGTLAKVAAIGYAEVEFAGYFKHSPKDIRALLDKNGLTAPSCHVDYDVVEKQWPQTIENAQIVGHQYIVCPSIDEKLRKKPDGYKQAAESFNKAGEASKKAGIQFAYHNHVFEFQPSPVLGGKLPYDFLLESTDAALVKMEMDLGWISVADQDPLSYFKRFPGRFPLVHVKDFKTLPTPSPNGKLFDSTPEFEKKSMTEPGSGVIDWKRIFSHSDEAGIRRYFVEHDRPADAFASLKTSYAYLSALRF
jgi:sugar phosphate isomerase/epimerase